MRYIISIGSLIATGAILFFSCAKEENKTATNSQLTNPYCNDPNAVNYNWGFPGKPDNSICFYPTDVFAGTWEYYDSVFVQPSGLFIYADSFTMTITKINDSVMTVLGFCGANSGALTLKAGLLFVATVDTTFLDSIDGTAGQAFCSSLDTVAGTFTKNIINDSSIYVSLTVYSDTGVISTHTGTAYRK